MNSTKYTQLVGDFLRAYDGFDDAGELANKNYKDMQGTDTTKNGGDKLLLSHVPKNYPATLITSKEASACYLYTKHSEESLSHPVILSSELSAFAAKEGVIFGISQDEEKKPYLYFIKDDLLIEQYIDKIEFRMSRLGTGENALSITTCLFLSFNDAFSLVDGELINKENYTNFLTVNQEFMDFYKSIIELFDNRNEYILDITIPFSVAKACVLSYQFDQHDDVEEFYDYMASGRFTLLPSPIAKAIFNLKEKELYITYQKTDKTFRIYHQYDEFTEEVIDIPSRNYFNRCLATGHFSIKTEDEPSPYESFLLGASK